MQLISDRTPNGRLNTTSTGHTTIEADWVRVAILSPDEFGSELLEHTLRFLGITTMARSTHPGAAASLATSAVETLLRFVGLEDGVDLAELQAARAVRPTIGLVVLTLARDLRLLGLSSASLPMGTRIVSVHDVGSPGRLSGILRSAARHPLASQRQHMRLHLTDEQIDALRAVAAGLDNDQFAAERSTTVSAARQLVNRTARTLGIPSAVSPSQRRAMMSAMYVRLLGGAEVPRLGVSAASPSFAS
jgi:hypothetical protein